MKTRGSRTRVRFFSCLLYALTAMFLSLALVANSDNAAPTTARPGKVSPSQKSPNFRAALPGYKFSFPRDHGSHPEFATEWWYYTGHLKSTGSGSTPGQTFGYQLTFFRTALTPQIPQRASAWATRNVIFAHLALTDETGKQFYFTDKISRDALGLAHAQTNSESQTPRIWIDDWQTQFKSDKGNQQTLHASGTAQDGSTPFGLSLSQRALKPLVIQGENGVSQKSKGRGRASHYYSFTRLQTTGTVRLAGREYSVTGESWFDHEFGSNVLSENQTGWDWFSIQLDDGRELMIFQLRLKDGGVDPYSSGTLIEKNGGRRHLKRDDFQIEVLDFWRSPHSDASYPARWNVKVPGANISLKITPAIADQELRPSRGANVTYWEGSVQVSGTQSGRGYVELTGYDAEFNGTF
jgi:predicted secreted hydrolase